MLDVSRSDGSAPRPQWRCETGAPVALAGVASVMTFGRVRTQMPADGITKGYAEPGVSGYYCPPMSPKATAVVTLLRTRPRRVIDRVLLCLAVAAVLVTIGQVVSPLFASFSTLGAHDWDEMESDRWLVVKSLREFHQFPFWNPYACGGFSAWGAIQGDTIVVSPWFPVYLLAPIAWAVRIEVIGCALISAMGTWLFAGRFTRSAALRAFACVVFAVNGRWALQTATGHAWHLYYAYTPWVFLLFDRAIPPHDPIDFRSVFLCGVFVALMVYAGGIYPLPQTALLVGVYATALSVMRRDARPLLAGAAVALAGGALAAPKLLSVLENIARWPRLVDSNEALDLYAFIQLLTERNQDVTLGAAPVPHWGWHEYGMYIGLASLVALTLGLVFAKEERARALKWVAVTAVLLGFGSFHPLSPWAKLHEWPIFKSQHVPSRWLYPAALLCAVVAAAAGERALARLGRWRPVLEFGLILAVAFIGMDIAQVAKRAMTHAFWMEMRPVTPTKDYHWEYDVPAALQYLVDDYAPPALPAEFAGIGVIRCTLHPGLNIFAPDEGLDGRPIGMGARGKGESGYHGEAYTASGTGTATLVSASPNRFEVDVRGATPGDLVVLNQNWDAGWKGNGESAENYHNAVAVPIRRSTERIVFRYRPRFLWPGLAMAAAAIGVAIFAHRRAAMLSASRRLPRG